MICMNYDHNKKFGLLKFHSGYGKFYFNSPKGYTRKIINAQTDNGKKRSNYYGKIYIYHHHNKTWSCLRRYFPLEYWASLRPAQWDCRNPLTPGTPWCLVPAASLLVPWNTYRCMLFIIWYQQWHIFMCLLTFFLHF